MTEHDNTVYLYHILDSIRKIEIYIDDYSFKEFISDEMALDAVLRNFEIIGEASNNLSDDFKENNAEVDFRSAVSIRNRLIHGYDDVDLEIVWNTVKEDLPQMEKLIKKILKRCQKKNLKDKKPDY